MAENKDELNYIYHFCSTYEDRIGAIGYYDGIADMKSEILNIDDYRELKKRIVLNLNKPHISIEDLTIVSLSRLK